MSRRVQVGARFSLIYFEIVNTCTSSIIMVLILVIKALYFLCILCARDLTT